jgi:3-methyladenine DNA glycosylase AlkC
MEPFKNEFAHDKALLIAKRIHAAHPEFPLERFRQGLKPALEPLELKQRVHLIAARIAACLPPHPPAAFAILVKSLARDQADTSGLRGFPVWPLTEIVARHGLGHFTASMAALREMTCRFTAEFAIRPFLRHDLAKTLRQLEKWTRHPDPHVRRLVSEGSRPLLPWGGNLPEIMENPDLTICLLDRLHRDPSDYVRLSVSNHLNDFSKKHPELVLQTLSRWRGAGGDGAFEKLARHACRTLIKSGHPEALAWHGFGDPSKLRVEDFSLADSRVSLGGHLGYRLVIRNSSNKPMNVLFDYAIFLRKANGASSPKVFKGRKRELAAGETWEIAGRHPIKPVTTRVYHSGLHRMEPRINGVPHPALDFVLVVPAGTG